MVLQKLFPAVFPLATVTTKDRRLARTKNCLQIGWTNTSQPPCSCAHPQRSFIIPSTSSKQSIRSVIRRLQGFSLCTNIFALCSNILFISLALLTPGTDWLCQQNENSSPYFLIIQLLPVP